MNPEPVFIDTNVLIYHLGQPDHEHGPRPTELFRQLRAGDIDGYISSTVILECIHVFRVRFGVPNSRLAEVLKEILSYPSVHSDHLAALVAALEFWSTQGPLSFADCFHLVLAKHLGMTQIFSFDQKMNRPSGVARIEP
jgi:predicted nucleic acid-binding protein